jgi:squalene-associated FAD-dependent desaturase
MTFHVVGGGLAGLAAACALARAGTGRPIRLYEAAPRAGGRCRSWHEPRLQTEIDNGTHVVLGANAAVRRHLAWIGAEDRLAWLQTGARMMASGGSAPWDLAGPLDLLAAWRRLGGPLTAEFATLARLLLPAGQATIGARLDADSRLATEIWRPLARAVMNTDPETADADAFARVLRKVLAGGRAAMRIGVARRSLADCFVDPALARLRTDGAEIRLRARLRAIERGEDGTRRLIFDEAAVPLAPADRLILALAPWDLAGLVPGRAPACAASAIVNLHVRLDDPAPPPTPPVLAGLACSPAEWVLRRDGVVAVTASAAAALSDMPAAALARSLWADAAPAVGLPRGDLPARWLIVKEKRATPLQTPSFAADRKNVLARKGRAILAGDWTVAGLPCTIEAALLSGEAAAARALASGRDCSDDGL